MALQYILYLILPFVSATALCVLAVFAFGRRRTPGAVEFGLLMLGACGWKLAYGLGLFGGSLQTRLFFHNLEYVGVAVVSVAWLAFVLRYTGFEAWLSWRRLFSLSALPLLTIVLVWTNGAHRLVWINRELERSGPFATISLDYGPWFWVFTSYCYCLALVGTLLLIALLLRSSRAYRKQTAAVLGGVGVLCAGNVAYLMQLSPIPYLNPTLLSFPLTGVLFAWSMFRLQLLDVAPIARDILIERIADGVIVVDGRNRVVDLNVAAERILDRRANNVLWHPAAEVLPEILPEISQGLSIASEASATEEDRAQDAWTRGMNSGAVSFGARLQVTFGVGNEVRYYERTLSTLDGRSARPGGKLDSQAGNQFRSQPGGYLILLRDTTERRELEKRLEHQALHDPLTNLPNRTLLTDRIARAVQRIEERVGDQWQDEWGSCKVAVLFIDLDAFKAVNDSLGHEVGDMLLVMAAQRIKECLRPNDTLARMGGDEFVAVVEDALPDGAITVAERIAYALNKPFHVGGHELFTSASIGISISDSVIDSTLDPMSVSGRPSTTEDKWEGFQRGEYLIRRADIAMYQAKKKGGSRHETFAGWMDLQATERLRLINDLSRAIEREEFVLYYQPIADLTTGKIESFEALLRWEHPERGLLLPDEFIGAAEQSGLMVPIGRWVLRRAARQVVQWHRTYPDVPPPSVSVNLSSQQFDRVELVEEVEEIMRNARFDPHLLKLEITESVAMKDVPSTIKALEKLRDLGIEVYLDDFGTGYSSLGYLTRFPVDALKIDRSIVEGLDLDSKKAAVARSILTLAHSLGQHAVAEGIETRGQLKYLRELECKLGQGNFLWAPLPAEPAAILYTQVLERTPNWASPTAAEEL